MDQQPFSRDMIKQLAEVELVLGGELGYMSELDPAEPKACKHWPDQLYSSAYW
jgi:hypothetical protein